MSGPSDAQAPLRAFKKTRDFFIGIDSDGCAFDTMEVKHKECFIPPFVKHFHLAAVSKYAREACEFVNLYSVDRGANRFPAYLKALDLLADRPEVRRRGFRLPPLHGLRDWIARESKLGNPTLKLEVDKTHDPDLTLTYEWSAEVNRNVEAIVKDVPPFPLVRESLEKMRGEADVMVVSATPGEALKREWEEHGLSGFVGLIAGQELGSKKEHLALAAAPDRYARDRVLMVGDAPGDRKAAEANGVLFYPINPGREDESWQQFHDDALPRFFAGTYAGDYMNQRIKEFEALLPETPPWKRA
jgi:phosphoglycolate phosphatase-like HAD superfamily hydrolase